MLFDFQTTTHGKWILAGEHAVIRGHGALIFPLTDKTLHLNYRACTKSNDLILDAQIPERDSQDICHLLHRILKYGMELIHQSYTNLRGYLTISSTIPIGVGMGASAALCLALSRWFIAQQWIEPTQQFNMARELEHFFHGQSSGLDIAGVSSEHGIYFQRGDSIPLNPTWSPQWRLSSCGEQGPTSDCIQKVQKLWLEQPERAHQIDLQMQNCVDKAKQALEAFQPQKTQQTLLIEAMQQANNCFEQWGLVTPVLKQHMHHLYEQGALAVKPTGSGGGGYVVSLWESF
ncbi:MAG TPA: mevalonate kinase [Legionellaceae bacterium]|nr:mevalonate kinase [Legionellaceae bacterium]